jgi:hypothetical protein
MLLVFPSQKGFVWVFKGCAPVGRSSGSLPPIQPRILEDPPILPTDSAIEPEIVRGTKPANVTVNGQVKFAIEGTTLYLLDDGGREHKTDITKKVLRQSPESPK